MPLHRLLQTEECAKEGGLFAPDDIARMTEAYEFALNLIRKKDCTDGVKELIAKKVVEIAREGETSAPYLCARVIKELGLLRHD